MQSSAKPLANKVALVTGGASGIGRALSEELALRGCEVVLADRQSDVASEVAAGIVTRGGRATAMALDVRSLPEFQAVAEETRRRAGQIDYLFNNAGIGVGGEMDTYGPADWDDVIDVNLRGVAHGIQAVYPDMVRRRSGHVVNTASMAGLVATAGEGSYTATKHAVVGLSKALRVEAKPHGVRVSVFCPGAIRTPILTGGKFGRMNFANLSEEAILRVWERSRPMAPAEFARRALDAVLRGEFIIIEPAFWKALWYLERVAPSLSLRLWGVLMEQVRKEITAAGGSPRAGS